MPSPFPGMDPYLEDPAGWGGVHLAALAFIQEMLNEALPTGYVAKVDEYLWVRDTDGDRELLGRPDVYLPAPPRANGPAGTRGAIITAPTARGRLPAGRKRKGRALQIVTRRNRRVLTVIELLSPANKSAGEDGAAYAHKRRQYLASVNLLEIDLLRDGRRLPMSEPPPPPADYYVFCCRRAEYPNTETWAFTVRDRLPVVPVPVDEQVPEVPLDLNAIVRHVYKAGGFDGDVDYSVPPVPPLRPLDAAWAAELLKKPARRRR